MGHPCLAWLPLLAGLAAVGARFPEAGRGDGVEELRAALESTDKWERVRAVERLARHGGAEAWELVVGALADPRGEVADTAEWLLGGLADEGVLEALLGGAGLRSREPGVRMRAAEALGRVPAIEREGAEALARATRDKDAEVRRMAFFSIERQAERVARGAEASAEEWVDAARRGARRERVPAIRARALAALVALVGRGAAEEVGRA